MGPLYSYNVIGLTPLMEEAHSVFSLLTWYQLFSCQGKWLLACLISRSFNYPNYPPGFLMWLCFLASICMDKVYATIPHPDLPSSPAPSKILPSSRYLTSWCMPCIMVNEWPPSGWVPSAQPGFGLALVLLNPIPRIVGSRKIRETWSDSPRSSRGKLTFFDMHF